MTLSSIEMSILAQSGVRLKHSWPFLAIVTALLLFCDVVRAEEGNQIDYSYRWAVTEELKGKISPPLKLIWNRSPILTLFNGFNTGDFMSEIPGRRLADTPLGLATVMKRTFYMLDKRNGATLWSLPLQGTGITDWKVKDNILVYAAIDSKSGKAIHAAADLSQRKHLWSMSKIPEDLYQPQWVMTAENNALYGTNNDGKVFDTGLTAHDVLSGKVVWHMPNKLEDMTLVRDSWFLYKNHLYAVTAPRQGGGLYLEKYDMVTGEKLEPELIIGRGEKRPSNIYTPSALTQDGILFLEFQPFAGKYVGKAAGDEKLSIAAYSINSKKLAWEAKLFAGEEVRTVYFDRYIRNIAIDRASDAPLLATIHPNIFAVINPDNGAIIKMQAMPGYTQWSDHSAILYSYPYLFAGAFRVLDKGKAYDLIALNLETGKIEWSYEISRVDNKLTGILNFVVSGNTLYASREDGRIMAFQFGEQHVLRALH